MKKAKRVARDEDIAKVGAALRRAASQARRIAERTNTPLVVFEEGRVVRKWVGKERSGQAGKKHSAGSGKPGDA